MEQGIAVNMGSGMKPADIEGYTKTVNVDARPEVKPDLVADLFDLPFAPGSVALIHSAHVLEHFTKTEGRRLLRYWHSLLQKPGGKLWLVVPNLEVACIQILKDGEPDATTMDILYGHQDYPTNFHKTGFTSRSLRRAIEGMGLWKVTHVGTRSNYQEVELKAEAL